MGHINKILRLYFLLLVMLLSVQAVTQVTKVMGVIMDSQTHEPIPFANIIFAGTNIGAQSDFTGHYSIETKNPSDTLIVSVMGYEIAKEKIHRNVFQQVNFELKSKNIDLPEVVILAGENPAEVLLRQVIKNKEVNSGENLEAYQYEIYNKIEIDANNLSEKFQQRKILKPFNFIFDYMDTSAVNGKTYLPVFLTESLSDYYYRKSPKSEKEVIKAIQVSGVENESVMQMMGTMFEKYNFYDNYIELFQKNFVSPIADNGLAHYKYYLTDSAWCSDKWCFRIMFKPRRKQEFNFTGHFWVHDSTYAIKSFEMQIVDDANINYINDLVLSQEFDRVDGKQWMVVRDKGIGDFNVLKNSEKTLGFFARKTTTYKNFVFNELKDPKFYSMPTDVVVMDKAYNKEEDFWDENRHETLSKNEAMIYHMVDTLKNLPALKTWIDIAKTIVSGYYENGKFEWGPYASTISFNSVEGARFRIGGRTTQEFHKSIRLNGHIAYGSLDKQFKYGAGALFMLNNNPLRSFGVNYRFDIEQLGNSPNAFREDFFFAALFRRNPADKLSLTSEFKVHYEHEWFNGFSSKPNFMYKEIIPVGGAQIQLYDGQGEMYAEDKIIVSEIGLETRFAYNEKFIVGHFNRRSLGTKYPVVGFQYSYGVPDLFGGEYEYHKLRLGIKHWFNVANIGWSKYMVETGKIFGTLPFPLLTLHPGNETFIFDEYAFNLMNYFEFVSDEYISVYYTHHFDGFFLNHIPLLRKLKWREVGFFKGVVGTLSERNKSFNELPELTSTLEKPYMEAGVGIENIFKIIRVDGIWRLSHLDNKNINKFALFLSLNFTF
jgi:hypothetical protein